ncbi:unnamed protein product [Penicillium glandicola]
MNGLGPLGVHEFIKEDCLAIDLLMNVLEQLSKTVPPDKIATRALRVLRIIQAVGMGTELPPLDASEGHEYENGSLSRIKLDIPYFGTIYFEPMPILPSNLPGQYYPSSSWMGTIPDPGYVNGEIVETAEWTDTSLDFYPTTEFWALNS